MRLFFFIVLVALSFSWNTAKAQGNHDFPQKIQQNWAFPGCSTPKKAVVFTKYYQITASKNGLSLKPRNKTKDLSPAAEGFKACDKPLKVAPPEMQRLIRYLDRMHKQCTFSIFNDCVRVGFKMSDENNDKKLTPAEIKKTVVIAYLFAELAGRQSLNEQRIKEITARAKKDGPKISDDLFKDHDSDKSKTLDYNELTANFAVPKVPAIKEMLQKAAKLIPVFGVVAATL